jgi:hypothetical protein
MTQSPPDHEYIFPDESDDSPPDARPTSVETHRSGRNYRRVISLLMIVAMLLAFAYVSVFPILRDNIQPDFDIVLMGVSAATNNCDTLPTITPQRQFQPTRQLCICGRLFTENNESYTLHLYPADSDEVIEEMNVDDQPSGEFCELMELEETLRDGRYRISVTTYIWETVVSEPIYFSIQSQREVALANRTSY